MRLALSLSMKRKFNFSFFLLPFFFFFLVDPVFRHLAKIDHGDCRVSKTTNDNFSLYSGIEFNSTDIPFSYRANDTSNIVHPIIDFFLPSFLSFNPS